MSSQAAWAAGEARSASLKSAGKVCTVPLGIAFLATRQFYDGGDVKSRFRLERRRKQGDWRGMLKKTIPQGLKSPLPLCLACGTTEVVPFHNVEFSATC